MTSFNGTHILMSSALPSSVQDGDVITSLNWIPSFTAFNNTYRNNRARCQLIKTYNVNVYDSIYDGCTGPGIQVFTDVCYWFESHPIVNWTVTNNVFGYLNYGEKGRMED